MTTSSDYDHLFKLLLIGDSSVGKTSILLSFTTDIYIDKDKPTIGVDLKVKLLNYNNKKLKLTIWDTAGQERFRTLTSAYYRGANAILLVYDITNRKSYESIKEWLKEVNDYCTSDNVIKMLVGNKLDKSDERVVQKAEAIEFARSNNMLFIETSAKTQTGIVQCFHELVQKILDSPSLVDDTTAVTMRRDNNSNSTKVPASMVNLNERPKNSYCLGMCYSNA